VDWVAVGPQMFSVLADGAHTIRILDVQGRVKASMQGSGRMEYPYPKALVPNSIYFLEVKSVRGINVRGFYYR
jgi:hypothetical protein